MTMIAATPQPREPDLPPGLRPVSTGARIGGRLLDGVLGSIAVLGLAWAIQEILQFGLPSVVGIIGVVLFLVWAALGLWAVLGRGSRLAGLLLGQRWIVVPDGGRKGGPVLGKLIVQSGIGLLTLGVGEPIISLATLRQPHNRNWFDRLTGLVLVTGARPASGAQAPRAQDQRVHVHQVGLPDHRDVPTPITNVGVRQVNAEFIESTPWSGDQVARPVSRPEPARRPAVIRPRAHAAKPPATPSPESSGAGDHTVFAPFGEAAHGPWLRLDDGTRIDLATTVVFGREPTLPPDLGAATPRSVTDPTMRLSKTHVAIGVDAQGVWVLDLYSTNGVRVARPDTAVAVVQPGQSTPVPVGSRVEFGGRSLEVCDG